MKVTVRRSQMKRKLAKLPGWMLLAALLGLALAKAAPSVSLAQAESQTGSQAKSAQGSLAEAYKIIASKQFVDLTHSFSPLAPVWKGFGPATFSAASDPETGHPYTIEKDGFRVFFYSMVGQYGTHVDPPAHFDLNGTTMDRLPLKQMILPLVVFDITPLLKSDPNHALSIDDVKAWEHTHG